MTFRFSLGIAALAALSLGAARPTLAQQAPVRPQLAADADTADWRAYYAWGIKHLTSETDGAAHAFYWAGRLNPLAAEPLFAQYVAGWLAEPDLYQRARDGDRKALDSDLARRLNTLYGRALDRDPMVNQQFERLLDDRVVNNEANNLEYSDDPLTQGMLAYGAGDFRRAVTVLGRATHYSRIHARYVRALAHYALAEYDSAAGDLTAVLGELQRAEQGGALTSVAATKGVYGVALGNVYRKAGKLDLAREAYRNALSEDVSLAAAHVALADLALVAGDPATATQEYGQAVDLRPSDGGLRSRFGDALRASGDLAGAAAQYRKAIELEPYFFVSYLNLGTVLDKQQKRDEAAAAYMQFLARAPKAFGPQIAAVQKRLGGAPAGAQ